MFEVIEITTHFTPQGHVAKVENLSLGHFDNWLEAAALRYKLAPNGGCWIGKVTNRKSVSMKTFYQGKPFDFADAFKMIEGDEAYQRVMDDLDPPQDEQTYVAAKLA